MEKIRSLFIIVLVLLFSVSCGHSQKTKSENTQDITKGQLKFILYSAPLDDCFTCTLKALAVLDRTLPSSEELILCLKADEKQRQGELKNFKRALKENFPNRRFTFLVENFELPHPSILLIKKHFVYMHFYLSSDSKSLAATVNSAMEMLINLSNLR